MSSDVSTDSAGDNTNSLHHCLTDSSLPFSSFLGHSCKVSHVPVQQLYYKKREKWKFSEKAPSRVRQKLLSSVFGNSHFVQFGLNPDKLRWLIRWRGNSGDWDWGRGREMREADEGFDRWTRVRSDFAAHKETSETSVASHSAKLSTV